VTLNDSVLHPEQARLRIKHADLLTRRCSSPIDAGGNDTPAIGVENSTAANRSVNIPEFVNVAPGGLRKIDEPVVDYYRLVDLATDAMEAGRTEQALPLLTQAEHVRPSP
jgi:hypothetical protein